MTNKPSSTWAIHVPSSATRKFTKYRSFRQHGTSRRDAEEALGGAFFVATTYMHAYNHFTANDGPRSDGRRQCEFGMV